MKWNPGFVSVKCRHFIRADAVAVSRIVLRSIRATCYINAGSQTVALYQEKSDGTTNTRYLHHDHLGSVDAITDETGTVVERLSFDAWGKRRTPAWQSDPSNTL